MNGDCESRVWEVVKSGNNWNDTRGWPDGDIVNRMGPCEPRTSVQVYFCAICGGPGGTRHHLIPKKIQRQHANIKRPSSIVRLCAKCHTDVHYYISHWELATRFNTEGTLKNELNRRKSWTSPCSV